MCDVEKDVGTLEWGYSMEDLVKKFLQRLQQRDGVGKRKQKDKEIKKK